MQYTKWKFTFFGDSLSVYKFILLCTFISDSKQKDVLITETRVTRLPHRDMGLYGVCPESDLFTAVLCSTCGAVVKAQALRRHIELRHPGETQSFIPPKQLPVKKSRPNILVKKPVKEIVPVSTSSSIENTTATVQAVVSLKPTENGGSAISGAKSVQLSPCKPPTSTQSEPEVANANISRRKSPNNDRKRLKEDLDTKTTQEISSSARTTPAKHIATQKRTDSTSRTVLVHRTPASPQNKNSNKQILEKYMRKGTKITIWGRSEETPPPVHVIHQREDAPPIKAIQSALSSPSSSGKSSASNTNTSNRSETFNKTFPADTDCASPMITSNNDWPNVQIEKMVSITLRVTCHC